MTDVTGDEYRAVVEWLYHEAELLDGQRFDEWFQLVSPAIRYTMPVRVTVHASDGDGVAREYHHFEEDYDSLATRVARATSPSAWAESPASRTRRFVTNPRVHRSSGGFEADSYLLLLRSRGDSPDFEFVSCSRRDELQTTDGGLKLVRREIVGDQSVLGTINLGVFL